MTRWLRRHFHPVPFGLGVALGAVSSAALSNGAWPVGWLLGCLLVGFGIATRGMWPLDREGEVR